MDRNWRKYLDERLLIPPDIRSTPTWAIPTASSVTLVKPDSQSHGFDFAAHAASSLLASLIPYGAPAQVQTLAMQAAAMQPRTVAKFLKKGAEIIRETSVNVSGYVLKMPGHPALGYIGGVLTLWNIGNWLFDHRGALFGKQAHVIPEPLYQVAGNQYLWKWPDGSVTGAPSRWSLQNQPFVADGCGSWPTSVTWPGSRTATSSPPGPAPHPWTPRRASRTGIGSPAPGTDG